MVPLMFNDVILIDEKLPTIEALKWLLDRFGCLAERKRRVLRFLLLVD